MKLVTVLAFGFLVLARVMQAAPLTQCPGVAVAGATYTGCNFLMTANADGTFSSVLDPSQPFIGGEDSYAGFQNNTSKAIASIVLSGNGINIFALDADGPSSTQSSRGYCPDRGSGATGYEGPGVSFSNVSSDCSSGQVNFKPAIPAGGSAYFFLEEEIDSSTLPKAAPGPLDPITVPERSSMVLTAGGLLLSLCRLFRNR